MKLSKGGEKEGINRKKQKNVGKKLRGAGWKGVPGMGVAKKRGT